MEAWIVADVDALVKYYGQGFARNVLPVRQNLEDEPKLDLYDKLARATRNTQKGEYGKIKHASQILQRIDATKVVARCPRFATFTRWLTEAIEGV
jgi:predicted metal-dependent HD superfamily phosphohydrolase